MPGPSEYVGGGFGSKFSAGREGVLGALLSKEAGSRFTMFNRSEEQLSAGNRPDSICDEEEASKDGEILGTRTQLGNSGTGTGGAGAHNDGLIGETDKIEYGVRTNTGGARPIGSRLAAGCICPRTDGHGRRGSP